MTQTAIFQVLLALLCAVGSLYIGIRFIRFPDEYISMYAQALRSVLGADWLKEKREGWGKVSRVYVRFMGGLGVCLSLVIFLRVVVKLISYLR